MVRDLCQVNEVLLRRFFTGLLYEEILDVTEDAEIFHLERRESEDRIIAKTICRPAAYSSSGVDDEGEGETG
jgi:hypothetical protein